MKDNLREAVWDMLNARPHMVPNGPLWLEERGWVEEDRPSALRWRSPHTQMLYTLGVAMHIERELICKIVAVLAGYDEEHFVRLRDARRKKTP